MKRYPFARASITLALTLTATVALAGCDNPVSKKPTLAQVEAAQRKEAEDDGRVICARNGSSDFARTCTLDRSTASAGLILTVRHPDGAFHRLLATRDGRGIVAADGAERALVKIIGPDMIEVSLGGDRYRLPATVKAGAGAR